MEEGFNFSTIASYVIYLTLFITAIIAMHSLFIAHYSVTFEYDRNFKYVNTIAKYLATSSCFVYKKNNTYSLPYVIDLSYINKHSSKNIGSCVPLKNYELIFYIPPPTPFHKASPFVKIITTKSSTSKARYTLPYPVLYINKGEYYSGLMILRVF